MLAASKAPNVGGMDRDDRAPGPYACKAQAHDRSRGVVGASNRHIRGRDRRQRSAAPISQVGKAGVWTGPVRVVSGRPVFRKNHVVFGVRVLGFTLFGVTCSRIALGQDFGAPPPEAQALVAAPAPAAAPPSAEDRLDGTTATLSAGGMLTTGNSRQLAATSNGAIETRFDANGIGFSLLANYARGGAQGEPVEVTAENVQGRLRYDRYLVERLSLFLINTARRDRFQGLNLRYNLDPGVKYLMVQEPATALWGELGYDFQYDIRRDDARIVLDADGNPVLGSGGEPALLDKTEVDHSLRAFIGFNHAFNDAVTLATGVEYLQSFVESERSRLNFDALFAAQVGGGLALGLGFGARWDHQPLPGKEELDTTTTVSLIYAFSSVATPPAAPACPACPEPAITPPANAPAEADPTPPPPVAPPAAAVPAPVEPGAAPGGPAPVSEPLPPVVGPGAPAAP
jgi:putative salt-induced outer membrane protein